jgi:hypothetical protein
MGDGTARAVAWLSEWDSQGTHRTGTVGDETGADWLAREAALLGATPATEDFVLERLDPGDAYLEFADARIPGLPLFDAPATTADGPPPLPSPSCRRSASIPRITKRSAATPRTAAW